MIYFITQNDQFVKIGYTKDSPEKRLTQLQVGNPIQLELEKVIHGGATKEADLHSLFGPYRERGEWYWLSREIRNYIRKQRAYGVDPIQQVEDHKGVIAILNNRG